MQRLLALTPEQRASLVQLRSICLSTLGTIIEERNGIHAFLTVRGGAPSTPVQQAIRTPCKRRRCLSILRRGLELSSALGLSELMHAHGPR